MSYISMDFFIYCQELLYTLNLKIPLYQAVFFGCFELLTYFCRKYLTKIYKEEYNIEK